jgi:hypothetical protein
MPASETGGIPEERSGPVIHDHRRIDPATGQPRRGKHAASKPAGTSGAGRPAGGTGGFSAMGGDGRPDEDPQTGPERVADTADRDADQRDPSQRDHSDVLTGGVVPPDHGQDNAEQQAQTAGTVESDLKAQLAERTSDLQRLQAEYANYRKRVDRDRAAVKEQAVAAIPLPTSCTRRCRDWAWSPTERRATRSIRRSMKRLPTHTHPMSPRTPASRSCNPVTRSGSGYFGQPGSLWRSRPPAQTGLALAAAATKPRGRHRMRKETRQPSEAG